MIKSLKARAQRNILNSLGFKTKRKLIVLESDDWGAVRMPSKSVYEHLLMKGIVQPNDAFAKFDGLESKEDLEYLFETLNSIKDSNDNPALLTANVIVGNPDFQKIHNSNFEKYYFESVEVTGEKQREFSIEAKWNEGLSSKVFFPQLHGREHVNVSKWLQKLKCDDYNSKEAFKHETYATDSAIAAAFSASSVKDEDGYSNIIQDASIMFEDFFGFKSKSFIAPNYTWSKSLELVLQKNGINFLQGSKFQNVPVYDKGRIKKRFHYTGQNNEYKQKYLVRNCLFEPTVGSSFDYVDICLKHIESAFYWSTPAIISTHRLNFVSVGGEKNRDENLGKLKTLLVKLVQKWPEVEFISTAELCDIMIEQ